MFFFFLLSFLNLFTRFTDLRAANTNIRSLAVSDGGTADASSTRKIKLIEMKANGINFAAKK